MITWDFGDDWGTAVTMPRLSAEQLAAMKEDEQQRRFRDAEKINTIERAREIAIEMGFPTATDYALQDLMKYAADKNAREFGDNYSIDYQMPYATRRDFDRYLAGTCAQYGIEKTPEKSPPVLALHS